MHPPNLKQCKAININLIVKAKLLEKKFSIMEGSAQTYVNIYPTTNNISATSQEPDELDTIVGYIYFYCTFIMSILSMFGCVVIILFYWFDSADSAKSNGRKILIFLSIADFLTAFGNIMGITWYQVKDDLTGTGEQAMCEFHATLTIFSSNASYFWTVSMTIYLYVCIVLRKQQAGNKLMIAFHIFSWALPGIIAIVVLSAGVIGWDDSLPFPSWCWIDPEIGGDLITMWQYLSGKLWEILSFVIIVIIITILKCKLIKQIHKRKRTISESSTAKNNSKNSGNKNIITAANKKLTYVPIVFLLCRIWGTLRFVINAHFPGAKLEGPGVAIIVVLQGLGDSAQGFANCVLFMLFTDKIRAQIYNYTCGKCQCSTNCTKSTNAVDNKQATPKVSEKPEGSLNVERKSKESDTETVFTDCNK